MDKINITNLLNRTKKEEEIISILNNFEENKQKIYCWNRVQNP